MLFRVDRESREFTPVQSSRVDVDKRQVTAWVDQPGTYGLIGLPTHLGVLETLRLLNRLSPQLLDERERGEHGLQDRICGLILCADPTAWDSAPTAPGDLCQKCLGLDVSWGRLPEKYLLERQPYIPPFREVGTGTGEEPPGSPALVAWGENDSGQLGDGSTTTRTTPVWVVPTVAAKKVVSGDSWTLALAIDGTVWAWGANSFGELGDGTSVRERSIRDGSASSTMSSTSRPARGMVLLFVLTVVSGNGESTQTSGLVARRLSPTACRFWWDSTTSSRSRPGWNHTLALRNDGRVFAWGVNYAGELGDGTRADRANPVLVPGLTTISSIAAGASTSYAIRGDYTVFSWGVRQWSIAYVYDTTPVPVPGLNYVEQISVGGGHVLARDISNDVWFWGDGMRGDGTSNRLYTTPVQVPFPGAPAGTWITDIAAGDSHSLALRSDGTVWAWGRGWEGQLGVNVMYQQLTPASVPLPAGRRASGVAAGMRWSLARLR